MTLKDQFTEDLQKAKSAEKLVRDTLSNLTSAFAFEDVSDNPQYYYIGDIKIIGADGSEYYMEVKDDSRIADTGKVLCEDEVYFKTNDYYKLGNMHSNYQYYCVVSKGERQLYIFDFSALKAIYKKGEYKVINHPLQTTYAYLLELCRAAQWGALIKKIKY